MRDAVTFEARGIPTVILVNDVFEPIAHATAALLALPDGYVANNVVWLPHPTSNLTATAAASLVDERIQYIRAALLGRALPQNGSTRGAGPSEPPTISLAGEPSSVTLASDSITDSAALEEARGVVAGLAESLRADGADLALLRFEAGVLEGEVRIGDLTCDDGSCIMPTDALERMVDAMLRPKLTGLERVALREVRLAP
jgi:hypothetical protein